MTHWTEDDIIAWLYGLKENASHLDDCVECRQRAGAASSRKAALVKEPEVSWEFLAAQRRSIYRRLGQPVHNWALTRWAVSVAMLLIVVVVSFALLKPYTSSTPLASPADEKLFSDLVAIDQTNEPRAIKPIHSLFEE